MRYTRMNKKILFAAMTATMLAACGTKPGFEVEGTVTGAEGKTLYLEASTLNGIEPLDSVTLKSDGVYAFRHERPASPEFYRLRLDGQVINFAIDSTETVRIDAPGEGFATAYTVEGSENSAKIKEMTLLQVHMQQEADRLAKAMSNHTIGVNLYQDSLTNMLARYKNEVKTRFIYPAPNTAAAYFALFQKINNYLIFDPFNNRDDVKCYAAVATSMTALYPEAERSKNLYNIVIKGMKNTRAPQSRPLNLPEGKVVEVGVIDIDLRDMNGNSHKLSDLKGKVVLVDFTVYQSAVSASHNYMLRDLYDKYSDKGLEIYQVSLDADEHYWKTTADNLPWICVRDESGVYSSVASSYNVQNLPSVFLVNRNNELSARGETIKNLDEAVRELLGK